MNQCCREVHLQDSYKPSADFCCQCPCHLPTPGELHDLKIVDKEGGEHPLPAPAKEGGWEKEFDERFTIDCSRKQNPPLVCHHWSQEDNVGGVKQFIHQVEEQAYQRGKDDAKLQLKDLQKMTAYSEGYQRGLVEMKEKLAEQIKSKKASHGRLHGSIDCEPCAYAELLTSLQALDVTKKI